MGFSTRFGVWGMGFEVKEFGNSLGDRAPRGYVVGAAINEDGSSKAMDSRLFSASPPGHWDWRAFLLGGEQVLAS